MTGGFKRRRRAALVQAIVLTAAGVGAAGPMAIDPAGRAAATAVVERPAERADPRTVTLTRDGEGGHYRVLLRALGTQPAPINTIHSWSARVETPDGKPATDAAIDFDGGMPEHGHGFPTQPRLVAGDEPGAYVIEGVKFSMTGLWRFEFRIRSGVVTDRVRFDVRIEDP